MARIRTIKPEFFRHEELYACEEKNKLPLRIAFAGLWTVADREGRFKWRPSQIKLDILPFDKVNIVDVLNALVDGKFIIKYSVDGKDFGCIPSFKEHQVINVREAKSHIPAPDGIAMVEPDKRTHVPKETRRTIFERDNYKCVRCGAEESITIDHIFPVSCGGTHALTNLRTLCNSCNSSRPVQGKALEMDLASDGLTWNDMQRMCNTVHAPDGREKEGKGKGKEHIQVACAVCGIFEKHYLLPEERMQHTANWFMTIDQQVEIILKEWAPDVAVKQIEAYKRHCKETKRKLIATDFKVAATLLSADWIKISAPEPIPKANDFAEAEYNRKLWTDEAWRLRYDRQIKTNKEFQEYFKLSRP